MDVHGKFAFVFATLSAFFVLSIMVVITTYMFSKQESRYGDATNEFALGKYTNQQYNNIGHVIKDAKNGE